MLAFKDFNYFHQIRAQNAFRGHLIEINERRGDDGLSDNNVHEHQKRSIL